MMHTYKSITMPVPAKAEHNRNVFLMEEKKFVEFAKALRLRCYPDLLSIRSNEYRSFIEFDDIQRKYSVSGLSSPSRLGIINSIMKEGHPISRSPRGELAPGVVQRPQERRFRSWKTWCFDYPGGPRLNREAWL